MTGGGRAWGRAVVLLALGSVLLPMLARADTPPDDGILLTVVYGTGPGQVALQWSGGQPTFQVFRSGRPDDVVAPAHKLGETNGAAWNDDPPSGNAFFYLVTGGLDRVPPTISASAAPPPDAAGWNATDVQVTFTCSDAGSGIATCPGTVVVGTEGAGQIISGTATDNEGNTAVASVTLNIDKTAPSLTITAPSGTVTGGPSPAVRLQYADGVSHVAAASLVARVDGTSLTGCSAGQTAAICPTPPLGPGDHAVDASIADVAGNTGTANLTFHLVLNRAPTLTPIGDRTAPLGGTLSLTVTGSDPDGDPTTLDVSPVPLPANATFDRDTGLFTFKPSLSQVGSVVVTFSISDGSLSDTETVTLSVPPAGGSSTLQGRVLDANAYQLGQTVPVVNATILLLGTNRSALTDLQGNFVVSSVPGGHQVLDIATATALAAPDGSKYGGFREAINLITGAQNIVDRPFFLPRINMASLTTVDPNATTVVTNPSLGAVLTVPPHTAKNADGTDFTGQLSISLVPKGLAPAQLPSNLDAGLLVTIQPVGVVFAAPVPLSLANVDGIQPDNDMDLWSLLANEGRFAVVGRGAVSSDGQRIETVAGGVRAADWHVLLPPVPMISGPPPGSRCPEGTCCEAPCGSSFTLRDGALLEDYTLPGVRSLGASRTLRVAYRSTTADVMPIISFDDFLSVRTPVPPRISAALEIGGVSQGPARYYDSMSLPENADSSSRMAFQFDAADLSTGLYPYKASTFGHYPQSAIGATLEDEIPVVNNRASPIGSGWGIAGLDRLYPQADGKILLVDGDGTTLIFTPARIGVSRATGTMNGIRGLLPGMAALADGRPLITGGFNFPVVATAEIYDAVAGTWTLTGAMNRARDHHSATLLRDGRVLVAGGLDQSDFAVSSAELYNPQTGQFSFTTTNMARIRETHTATLLGDGRVLMAGGVTNNGLGTSTAELFDPASGTFTLLTHTMSTERSDHTATVLPDGRVLLAGGEPHCNSVAKDIVDIYDPLTQTFTFVGRMTTPRAGHRAALLPNGRVFIAGGANTFSCRLAGIINTAEVFDPTSGTSRRLTDVLCSPKVHPILETLPDGRILIAGGLDQDNNNTTTACADIYDPATDRITPTSPMTVMRGDAASVVLPDGGVLIAGGNAGPGSYLSTSEIFRVVTPDDGAFLSPPGDFSVFSKNPDGSFTRRLKDGTVIQFSAAGLQTAVIDRNNNTTLFGYDLAGRLATMTDPVSQTWILAYDTGGRLKSITDPASRVTQFAHDSDGNLVQIVKADGQTIGYTYDARHRLTVRTDERGHPIVHAYDGLGRLTSVSYPDGEVRHYVPTDVRGVVDPSGGLGTQANPAPITRTEDVVATLQDGNGHTTTLAVTAFGSPLRVTDPLGRVTQTSRDANGLPAQITRPNGSILMITRDTRGNVLTTTEQNDPNGSATTTFTYEPVFNQVTSIKDPLNHTTTIDHDTRGNATTITDARTKATTLTYDTRGLLTSSQDPLGNTVQFGYDVKGNVHTMTDPREKVTTLTRDPAGNVTASEDPLTHVTSTEYDVLDRVTRVVDPLNGITRYGYDESGNLTSLTDANGHTTTFTYDDRNFLAATHNPLGQTRSYFYDPARNLDHVIDAKGQRIEFTYDDARQLTRKVLKNASAAVTDTVNYEYDLLGSLATANDGDSGVSFTYDPVGRLSVASTIAGPAQPASAIAYLYDKLGNRTRMTDPDGNPTTYVYDNVNRLTSLTSIDGTFTFGYDDAGRRTSLQFPNTTKATYDYDAASQLTALRYLSPAQSVLSKFDYTYNDKGSRDSRTTLDGVTSYTYDSLDRLSGAVGPDPAHPTQTATETYAYDAVGNRTSSHLAIGQVHDAANRLLEDSMFIYTYDANGNLTGRQDKMTAVTTTYDWDVEDHLIAVHTTSQIVSFKYDPMGRRIEKSASATSRFLYDQEDIVEELDGNNGLRARYTHGPGADEALAQRTAAGPPDYFEFDGLGSVVGTRDSAGTEANRYRYDSFGNPANANLSGFSFVARERDSETDLEYFRNRYYDPGRGRFISEDPIGFSGGTNAYRYVRNQPTGLIDPEGLSPSAGGSAQTCTSVCSSQMPPTPPRPPDTSTALNVATAMCAGEADEVFGKVWFVNMVRPRGPWDHKLKDPLRTPNRSSRYADYGNFEFGATCRAIGFSEDICLRGAGFVQAREFGFFYAVAAALGPEPYGDNADDPEMIRGGFRYFDMFKAKLECGCP